MKSKETKNIQEYNKQYWLKKREELSDIRKQYRDNNKVAIGRYLKEYTKKKRNESPFHKLKHNLRNVIINAIIAGFKPQGKIKKNNKMQNYLGCTPFEFITHLESLFEPWMNWDNRGGSKQPKCEKEMWDVDHIIQLSTAMTIEELIKLNHYTNIRPRCSYLNRYID